MTKSVSISSPAWALLDMLQREGRGGPVPDGLKAQFMELRVNGLARMSGPAIKITEAGQAALRDRVVGGTPDRWSFIRHHDIDDSVTWLWQRFGPDGRLQKTSQPQPNYGKALVDALGHGFRPSEHDYSVDLPHGKLHFPPGRNPVFSTRISQPKPPDVLLPQPRSGKETGLHRVIGSYTTQRDGRRTYKYQLRWSRRGNDIAWEAYVFLDGRLMGQPGNIVPCHNAQLSESIARAFLEKAIEEIAAKRQGNAAG